MRPQFYMFAFGVFIIGTMLSAVVSGNWLLEAEQSFINAICGVKSIHMMSALGVPIIVPSGSWVSGIATMLSWNYAYLDNAWGGIFKLFLYMISAGVIIGLIQMFLVAIQALASGIKALLPWA